MPRTIRAKKWLTRQEHVKRVSFASKWLYKAELRERTFDDSMHRATTDHGLMVVTRTSWARELVQRHANDVVLAATLFKPNAVESSEFSSAEGFGQRQILKARDAYLGGRVVLGVTPLHVHALVVAFGRCITRTVACWLRSELGASPIVALGDTGEPAWPALLIFDRDGKTLAELQAMWRDDEAWRVLALLLG